MIANVCMLCGDIFEAEAPFGFCIPCEEIVDDMGQEELDELMENI